ncbi:exopolysaccharide production repressor exox [Mesorhizobium sp. M4B.F.Ca.ET.089.01.1.1]|uniref:exopolysaccharide production repressor exox n=2 Tax=Mesorhizobium TaxID=68287 RepID=UPI001FE04F83|nr:exopolysaccharide production repressor exox [Mesorhizobium sp. M4B.F.Ca.ET.089.01.1.1]
MAHGEILGWVSRHFCMLASVDGSTEMSLPKFIFGMLFALAIVISWSYFEGASLGTIVLRTVICAAIIQAGYFVLVFLMVARSAPTTADRMREAERSLGAPKAAEGEKFSARRSIR